MDLKGAIEKAGETLGYSKLMEEQFICISKFIEGSNVFCILPTGHGKNTCFVCLPKAFDFLNNNDKLKSVIIVVSPLTALIKDQVEALCSRNISVGYIDGDNEKDVKSDVVKGKF